MMGGAVGLGRGREGVQGGLWGGAWLGCGGPRAALIGLGCLGLMRALSQPGRGALHWRGRGRSEADPIPEAAAP